MSEDPAIQEKERSLLADLGSPKRTARIAAVVQLSKIGMSRKALHELRRLIDDPDRETALFVRQAVARIQARLGETTARSDSPGLTRERLLTPLENEVPALRQTIAQMGDEIPDELRPATADFLSRHGDEEDGELLLRWMEKTDSLIALTYMDALENLLPRKLIEVLPRLLASEHSLIRVRAIRTLKRIDPQEAQAHLSESLASRQAEERIAGLSIAFFFPFRDVKPLVLTMLSEEKDPDVLKAAETFLQMNPEVDTVLRLLDMIDMRPKEQSAFLSRLFRVLCDSLKVAKILPEDQARPEALIALWRRERLKKFLADMEIQLSFCDPTRRVAIESWLSKNSGNPEVAGFIEKLGGNPAHEEMFHRLLKTVPPRAVMTMNLQNPAAQTSEQKQYFLEHLNPENFAKVQTWVRQEAGAADSELRLLALKALVQYGGVEDCELAEKGLQSGDPKLQLAGMQILDKWGPQRLIGFLNGLLTSENPLVRSRAVRLSLKLEPDRALESFKSMLVSSDLTSRAQAVGCLVLFPFLRIQTILLEQLSREDNTEIARHILAVVRSNPSPSLLRQLDSVQNTVSASVSILIAQGRMDLFDVILQLGMEFTDSVETPEPTPEEQTGTPSSPAPSRNLLISGPIPPPETGDADSRKKRGAGGAQPVKTLSGWAPKPYSVSEVRSAMRKREVSQRGQTEKNADPVAAMGKTSETSQMTGYFLAFLVFLALGGWMVFSISRNRTYVLDEDTLPMKATAGDGADSREIPVGFRMGAMCRLTGKIEKVNEDRSFVFVSGERTFSVKMKSPPPDISGGETADVELVPYRKRKTPGDYLSDGYRLELR
jgi:HEAT repeat protein